MWVLMLPASSWVWVPALAPHGGPFGLNLHYAHFGGQVMPETVPRPLPRSRTQPARNRIAVDVAQLFHKLLVVAHVAVIVAALPHRPAYGAPSHAYLERLQRAAQHAVLGLAHQQVDVLRHQHIAIEPDAACAPHPLQRVEK